MLLATGDGYWTFTHVAALTCGLGFVMYGCWLVYVEEYMGRGRSRAVAGHLSTGRDPFHDAKTVRLRNAFMPIVSKLNRLASLTGVGHGGIL